MTPMFPEGENNRLGAHAARPEPVPESSSRLAVLVRAPEGFALHREPPAGAVPVPAHAGLGNTAAACTPPAPVALHALTRAATPGTIHPAVDVEGERPLIDT